MAEARDCREELYERMVLLMAGQEGSEDLRQRMYIILADYEIIGRSMELAPLEEDRNEFLLRKFLIAKTVKGCTERTIRLYRTELPRILQGIGKTVDDITPDDIRLYIARRTAVDGVSKVTAGNELRYLRSFFSYLHGEELITKNPMNRVETMKVPRTKKEAFTEVEIEKIRNAARDERETAMLEVMLSTGCRVSELVNIRLEEIDYMRGRVLLHGKGEKDRYAYLNAKALISLEKYLNLRKDSNPYLFAGAVENYISSKRRGNHVGWWKTPELVHAENHLERETPSNITRHIGKLAGLNVQCNPHKFRRTCATLALKRGMPVEQVSMMLGHESIQTTQIYLDISESDLQYAHGKYVV